MLLPRLVFMLTTAAAYIRLGALSHNLAAVGASGLLGAVSLAASAALDLANRRAFVVMCMEKQGREGSNRGAEQGREGRAGVSGAGESLAGRGSMGLHGHGQPHAGRASRLPMQ